MYHLIVIYFIIFMVFIESISYFTCNTLNSYIITPLLINSGSIIMILCLFYSILYDFKLILIAIFSLLSDRVVKIIKLLVIESIIIPYLFKLYMSYCYFDYYYLYSFHSVLYYLILID